MKYLWGRIRHRMAPRLALLVTLCCILLPMTGGGSVDAATSPVSLSATPNTSGNCINLSWSISNKDQKYSYMLYSKPQSGSTFQTIPAKSSVKVLDVYPDTASNGNTGTTTFVSAIDGKTYTVPVAGQVKKWMEQANSDSSNGYGKGLISVDDVSIVDFNNNPNAYLTNSSGSYQYDVVVFGFWDSNNGYDLTAASETAVQSFLSAGRGVLFGHDTIGYQAYQTYAGYVPNPNFEKLIFSINASAIPSSYKGDTYPTIPIQYQVWGSTSVTVSKKGLLTNYPWNIGDVGTKLNIPFCHTAWLITNGDNWLNFSNIQLPFADWTQSVANAYMASPSSNMNAYLTTWNNAAYIQTGHSSGQATADEQKVLANTIFYLAQITENTSWSDHQGQDLAAPNAPTVSTCTHNADMSAFTVSFTAADNASGYQYYVEATGESNGTKYDSATVTASISSGIRGYSIVVDSSPDTVPGGNITTISGSYTFSKPATNGFYVHIRAVDNAGNMSAVTHYHVDDAISATCPTGVSYTINPTGGSFTAPEIPITNNSNIPVRVSIQSFKAAAGGTVTFHDVPPSQYADWGKLTAAQTKSDIAMALAVDSGSSSAWSEIDLKQPVYSAQITSPVSVGVLKAKSTGSLALSAKYGRAWSAAVTSRHQLVLGFNMI